LQFSPIPSKTELHVRCSWRFDFTSVNRRRLIGREL